MRIAACMSITFGALALAGCGSTSPTSATSPANTSTAPHAPAPGQDVIQLKAASNGALKFDRNDVKTLSGKVQLSLANPSGVQHNIAIKGNGVDKKGPVVGNGGVSIVNVQLKPGDYEFYCSVDGHEQAGMKGTLHVGTA
jgi:plastocyanin